MGYLVGLGCMVDGRRLPGAQDAYKLLPFPRDDTPRECDMFNVIQMLFAGLGAGLILAALAFVTLLIGVLVNAMIALFAGPLIDRLLARKAAA
jgi:hypothetical protein